MDKKSIIVAKMMSGNLNVGPFNSDLKWSLLKQHVANIRRLVNQQLIPD